MMNRDENPARPKPEQIRQASIASDSGESRRVLYPVDPSSKGTWVGVNEQGVTLALM